MGNILQGANALDVVFQALAPGTGTGTGDGVGRFDDNGFYAFLVYFVLLVPICV
jgi:hypothetical protein